jgi:hypothetical protein
MALRSLKDMTKGDLVSLGEIVKADLPRMGTKDMLAEAINERLMQIKAENFKEVSKPFAPPAKDPFLPYGKDTDDEVMEVDSKLFYLSVVGAPGSRPFNITVTSTVNVAEVKKQISVLTKIPFNTMRLLYRDGDLENHKSLHEHNILSDSEVRLLESRLRGGGKKRGNFKKDGGDDKDKKKKKDGGDDELMQDTLLFRALDVSTMVITADVYHVIRPPPGGRQCGRHQGPARDLAPQAGLGVRDLAPQAGLGSGVRDLAPQAGLGLGLGVRVKG